MINKRIQPLIGFRTKHLNFIHRDDLVNGILQAAESPKGENEIFFLGGEKNYTAQEIGDIIAGALGKSRMKIYLPESAVYLIGALAEAAGRISGQSVFFNRQKVKDAVQPYWTCSIKKSKKLLNYKEMYSLEEGMQNVCQWYKENGWL
jgi:nucleoside-diphosphate-sugar epimerase